MLEVFSKFDPAQILNYGISGLGFLLASLAFYLLRNEQQRETPNRNILISISLFMVFSLIVVGGGLISEFGRGQRDETIRKLQDQLNKKNVEVWHVTGFVQSDPDSPIQHDDEVDFTAIPPMGQLFKDKRSFGMQILVTRSSDGKPNFPKLLITRLPPGKFESVTIQLKPNQPSSGNSDPDYQVHPSESDQEININKAIEFKRTLSIYNGMGAPPIPAPGESPAITAPPGNNH